MTDLVKDYTSENIDNNLIKDTSLNSYSNVNNDNLIDQGFEGGINWSDINNDNAERPNKMYDAVVALDGTGDYRSIQDALNAGRDRIFIKNGTYWINEPIELNRDNLLIVGENKHDVVLKLIDSATANATQIFHISSGQIINFECSNITLSGNQSGRGNGRTDGFTIEENIIDFKINNCIFEDFDTAHGGNGIILSVEATRFYITDNSFDNCFRGILLQKGSYYWILNNYFGDCNTFIDIRESDYFFIENNIFIGDGNSTGINLLVSISGDIENGAISNNHFFSCNEGIYFEDNASYYPNNININNNIFEQITQNCITCNGVKNINIIGNQLINVGEIVNTYYGIILQNTSTFCNVSNNQFLSDSLTEYAPKYWIYEASSSDDYNIIMGNIAIGAKQAQIYSQGPNSIVEHNIPQGLLPGSSTTTTSSSSTTSSSTTSSTTTSSTTTSSSTTSSSSSTTTA